MLWEHTRKIRIVHQKAEQNVVLEIKDKKKKHRHHDDDENFEWVRTTTKRSSSRRRSKSPSLLMYLAGARPA